MDTLTLVRLHEIQTYLVGSHQWKNSVYKYALITLTPKENDKFKSQGSITKQLIVGPCNDHKIYRCFVKLVIVGKEENSIVGLQDIEPQVEPHVEPQVPHI